MAVTSETSVVHLNASTHFPIKLTPSNFPVWSRQVQSTLIGMNLDGYIDGTTVAPAQFSDTTLKVVNPLYLVWYRQDQTLVSALMGSCSDAIQPVISSTGSAHDAWCLLNASYANASRGRIVSLKAKLAKNPKGGKTISEFLHEMRAIADELALVQSPVSEEDLVVHVITQLGDEFISSIVAAIRVRETPIAFSELTDVLTDYERVLKANVEEAQNLVATANVTQKQRQQNYTRQNNNSNRTYSNHGGSSNFRRSGNSNNNYNRQNQV